jgi:putative ABC transport system substrate-binding protein
MPVIGFLSSASGNANPQLVAAFHEGLNEAGYREGRNVTVEYRWAEGRYAELPQLAADLVRRNVAVLYAFDNTATAQAAKASTSTIPVVFSIGADPVKFGLVASLNHPGGNVTGVVSLTVGLGVKRLQILRELAPKSIALLVNPKNPNAKFETKEVQEAAKNVGQTIIIVNASSESEIDAAFASIGQQQIGAVLIESEPFFSSRAKQIASLAVRYALPAIDAYREFPLAGGLMSYGASLAEARRQAGHICWTHSQRRESCRSACGAIHENRACYQFEGGQGARPLIANRSAGPRRRGDRVIPASACAYCCICSRPVMALNVSS